MLTDGMKFVGKNTLPASGVAGELIYLLLQDGENSPGFYRHTGVTWEIVGQGVAPSLDLSAVDQDVVPDVDNVRSLGSATKMWKDVFIGPGSLYVNGQKVIEDNSGTITLSADLDQNIQIKTGGGGDIEFYPSGTGNIDLKGNVSIQAGKNMISGDGNPINCTVGFVDLDLTGDTTAVNLVISGNLTVNGTTTTVNTETINLADNIITLNSNATGTPTENAGIMINRGDLANAQLIWNETNDQWEVSADGVTFYKILDENDEVGGGGGASVTYKTISTDTTAVANDGLLCLTSNGAISVTLPASPTAQDIVKIIDSEASASTNNITIIRNGSNIMGLDENMTVETDNANFTLVYIDAAKGWMIG